MNSRSGGGETFIYRFNEFGRAIGTIMPSGESIEINSRLVQQLGLGVTVHAHIQSIFSAEKMESTDLVLNGGIKSMTMKIGDQITNAKISTNNNTLFISSPNGVIETAGAIAKHPLLEKTMPTEAEMLPMWSHQTASFGDGLINQMYSTYNLIGGDARNPQQIINREIWVNNSRVLGIEFEQFVNRQIYYDKDREPILTVTFDQSGLPLTYRPGNNGYPLNISYDRYNRIESWKWGHAELKYTYERHGLLSEITSQQDGTVSYIYNDNNLISEIGLASQRKFILSYDSDGGLRSIKLPSGTKHMFSYQPSIGFIRATYTPPGSAKPYLQHYSYSGVLLLTVYPGDGARIIYRYNSVGELSKIIHGDGKTEFTYDSVTGMPNTISHSERDLEYQCDFDYVNGILTEERIDYVAKAGLSNAKFTYEHDSNMRLSQVSGRIGGTNLPVLSYVYSSKTGRLQQIGQFKVGKTKSNTTTVSDGVALFSRTLDGRFLETQMSVMIHRMEVFRMEFSHDIHGRILQTKTYTKNVGVNTYTNIKNYTWDCDGQLIGVEAQEPWGFRYDDNGNLLSLTYRGNTIPMEYNTMDRIVKFGEGQYKYDARGLVAQNAREERFHYNTQGLLVRATKRGRFDVRYYYDHLSRLITRKDNFGNVTQFFYNNNERPYEISQIYSPRDGKLMTLLYDDRGHLIYAQVFRHKYYVATDQSGTPIMIFNQYGEGIREIMRSPYGHIVYDSNPYLYLPIDFCGGILDQVIKFQ